LQILGKAEFLNPGGSVKDRVAVKIIEEVILPSCLDRTWFLCGRVRSKNCKIEVVVRSCRTGLLVLEVL
jgi:hypothetical protein